jgi:superfamily I DNA/RNA helicase
MPTVEFRNLDKQRLDTTVKAKILTFIAKLSNTDESNGLRIKPLQNARDPRVRTGRVDDNFRAVLVYFKEDQKYQYIGTWPHDEAIKKAVGLEYGRNPKSGVTEALDLVAFHELREKQLTRSSPNGDPGEHGFVSMSAPLTHQEDPNDFADRGTEARTIAEALGVHPDVIELATSAKSGTELLEILENAPEWQAIAVLDIASGSLLEEIRTSLGIGPVADDLTGDEADLTGQQHPAARMEFTYLGDSSEDVRRAIENGDFDAWRTFLHPAQRALVDFRWNGSARISGGAGTGKTVVLVHRAVALSREDPGKRIIATTFTTTLAEGLRASFDHLAPNMLRAGKAGSAGILVKGIDSLISSVIRSASKLEESAAMFTLTGQEGRIGGTVLSDTEQFDRWRQALTSCGSSEAAVVTPEFIRDEYEAIILPQRIASREEYLRAPRRGRGVSLPRRSRDVVWKAVENYRVSTRRDLVGTYPEWAHLAAIILEHRAARGQARLADHILVDEGQDLHEGHWMFIRAIVAERPDDVFISEDSQQRIYGRPLVLSQFGINIVGRSRRLKLNYRTTKQNLDLALQALRGNPMVDLEGTEILESGYFSARSGPTPRVLRVRDRDEEIAVVAKEVRTWVESSSEKDSHALEDIAVLVPSNADVDRVIRRLDETGLSARRHGDAGGGISVLTMHRAKGLEFRAVVVTSLGESTWSGTADQVQRRALLYVAATRARDLLVLTHVGPLTHLLSEA